MDNKIKVLHIINGADLGGISTFILNYYSHMNRDLFLFDFVMYKEKIGVNGMKLMDYGCHFFSIPAKSKHLIKYYRNLSEILKKGNYDVIHVHTNTSSYIPLLIAKKAKIKIRIAHAHSAVINQNCIYKIKTMLAYKLIPYSATHMCACSNEAGRLVFGTNNFQLVPNAIDTDKFSFNETQRFHMRNKMDINQDCLVLGMVGRLSKEKNTQFAIKCFSSYLKVNNKAILLIAGDGILKNKLYKLAVDLKIEKHIVFLGQRKDVENLYQAMDIFLLPSEFEGFPIAALEALSTGLPVLLSDNITKDINISRNMRYLPINECDCNINKWVNAIEEFSKSKNRYKENSVQESGFSISECVGVLERVYLSDMKKEKEIYV